MPVHSREKKESNHEEMEVDFPEQDGSSTDEEDTVSSSVSEDGDSSGRKNRPDIPNTINILLCHSRVHLDYAVAFENPRTICPGRADV